MNAGLPPILVVDDEKNMRISLTAILEDEGYQVAAHESAEEGLTHLATNKAFMVLTDARLGGMSGYEFLDEIKQKWPDMPVLMITAHATPKLAVEAIKSGAIDYLAKPFAPEELILAVARCAERHELLKENANLRARASEAYQLDHIIGETASMMELKKLIQTVAPTDATVLILGESGTGKELIAGALHSLGRRSGKNYIRINCAAIPDMLLESELFGHEKGAFTGALRQKHGLVEDADGGTIFLDEIGDMSRSLQAKLLRFLEDGSFSRVGGNEERRVDVRLIAATNRDVIQAIREDRFREDLYYRLNVMQFRPPPLRDRRDDILLLARHFLEEFTRKMGKPLAGLSSGAEQKLLSHHWAGNVRELRNAIERAVIIETEEDIQAHNIADFHLETGLKKEDSEPAAAAPDIGPLAELMADYETRVIEAALERSHFSLSRTAEELSVSRHALRYRMQRLNINVCDNGAEKSNGSKDAQTK
ncbi:MAG: DNA-binding NtrC family response regulator [Candidatus Binatia bacterium]|jgi:DNA-binding NtrC family response regulator